MTNTISFSQEQQLATIAFNRPEVMNSFNEEMADELEAITEQVRADNNIRAVLLKGIGPLFMAGGDIRFFHNNLSQMSSVVMSMVRRVNISIINLMQMPKPVLAAVHGSVAGVGMSFMMAADLVIAAEDTKFTMAYSGLGVSPDGGASYNLPRMVGAKKALEMILFSELMDAETMHKLGLVNWVVPSAKLAEETQRILNHLMHGPTIAYAQAKKLINQTWDNSLETQLEAEGRSFELCAMSKDFKQGVTSFLEKKKPQFEGK